MTGRWTRGLSGLVILQKVGEVWLDIIAICTLQIVDLQFWFLIKEVRPLALKGAWKVRHFFLTFSCVVLLKDLRRTGQVSSKSRPLFLSNYQIMFSFPVNVMGRLKLQDWTMTDKRKCKDGHCRTGHCRTGLARVEIAGLGNDRRLTDCGVFGLQ